MKDTSRGAREKYGGKRDKAGDLHYGSSNGCQIASFLLFGRIYNRRRAHDQAKNSTPGATEPSVRLRYQFWSVWLPATPESRVCLDINGVQQSSILSSSMQQTRHMTTMIRANISRPFSVRRCTCRIYKLGLAKSYPSWCQTNVQLYADKKSEATRNFGP